MEYLFSVVALVAGLAIGWLVCRARFAHVLARAELTTEQLAQLQSDLAKATAESA